MLRRMTILGQNLGNIRKSPRVADESMFGGPNNPGDLPIIDRIRSTPRWKRLGIICSIVRAPILSIFSCFSQPQHNHHNHHHQPHGGINNNALNAYGVWSSGEFAQISEMNHLMVSDSMRYAILM